MSNSTIEQIATRLVEVTGRAGAIHVDAMAISNSSDAIAVRNGSIESVEREDARGIGVRAFCETERGLAFATASSSDLSGAGIQRLAEQVVAMARISEPDPDAVPPTGASHPSSEDMAAWQQNHPSLDHGWSIEAARETALACEADARNYSDKISNSEGADASFGSSSVVYAASDGFVGGYSRASASLSVSVIAGSGEGMQRDYAWHRAATADQLKSAHEIAEEAARRAVSRLNPGTMPSGKATVLFEPRTATSLLGHLISAINGRSVLQQRSFLADALHTSIFPGFVSIEECPDHPEGMANRLFDGEGTKCAGRKLIAEGELTTFLTDRYAAKRLKMAETGSATRGLTGDIGIGTSNLIWQPGELDQTSLINQIDHGLLLTEMIGFGVNGVTGDYSRGAAGFLIEAGEIVRPVSGITIAGNLGDMFNGITAIGSDLTWFGSSAVPSIAIDGMTIAGA